MHGMTIPLCTRPSRRGIQRVYVKERVLIAANTVQNVPVKLIKPTWRSPTSVDWVVHPKQLKENVYTARFLLPGETRYAAVRVVNLSEHIIDLPADTDLGTAEVATFIQDPANDTGPKSL